MSPLYCAPFSFAKAVCEIHRETTAMRSAALSLLPYLTFFLFLAVPKKATTKIG
jgi:hypothetical protein